MDEPPTYHLDVEGVDDPLHARGSADEQARGAPLRHRPPHARPWIGIRFDCCNVYTRIYRDSEGRSYRGRCPRCLRTVTLRVGPSGTNARFFVAE